MDAGTVKSASPEVLPDEIRQIIELKRQQKDERISALSKIVSKKRTEAVNARKSSGIERIWTEDEEYYIGIDDLNRDGHAYTKGATPDAGLSSSTRSETNGRCKAFFNITRQFVDSAAARMGDILLPAGDWNFNIKATPVPDLAKIKDSKQQVVDPVSGQPKKNPDGSPYTLGQFASQTEAEASEKVEKAELRIRDWLTECSYHAEIRKVIEDAAKIGTGVIRGAYPGVSKVRAVIEGNLVIEEKTVPTSKRVDPRNFFPDPSCGDNIQKGNYVLERDYLSARQLRSLKNAEGYIAKNIDQVLEEGANKSNVGRDGVIENNNKVREDERFEVWYFFGNVDIDDLDALGATPRDETPGRDEAPAVVVLVNDTVIKGFVNPLDNGEFPYDVMPWQRTNDSPYGIGVARQGRTAQDMLNGAARTMMENAGLSAAPQIIVRQSAIRPADGDWKLVKGKIWLASEEADTRSVGDAFLSVAIPSMQAELANIIGMANKFMEDATGVSFLLQGQQGSAPDTVGGMELLHKNSSSLLRRIARVFDEAVTEPHIRRYYDWLLIHGEDDEKGDLQIEAIGSTSLVEREIQSQQAAQILQMSLNPIFEMSPAKAKDELLRAWRFDPSKFALDEEEKKKAAQMQPAPAPQVQAAQIRAQADEKLAQMKIQSEQQHKAAELDHEEQMLKERIAADMAIDKNDLDRDTAYNQSISNRDSMTYQARMAELELKKELAMMEYANRHQISLEQIKAKLSDSVMKLRTQKELSAAALQAESGRHGNAMTPPTEPAGRAPNGQAFAR